MTDSTPRERRYARTRQAILDAARQLIAEQGLDKFSLRELARRVDYSPAGLYEYFSSKDEIVTAVAAEGFDRLSAYLDRVASDLPPAERLVAIGLAYVGFAHNNPDYFTLMFSDLPSRRTSLAEAGSSLTDEKVRVGVMNQLCDFVTESSRHNAEYVPYFSRTQELREAFNLRTRTEPVPMQPRRQRVWQRDTGVEEDQEAPVPPLQRSHEYASAIIEARLTGTPFCFNGSMMNHGSITNLPSRCSVEVPCLVDREGIHPIYVGALPAQCAALNMSNIAVQELAVRAVLDSDREAAFHAVALDPLTAATLSLTEIRSMFEEMWEAERDWLRRFED